MRKIEISPRTFIFGALFILAIYLAYHARSVLYAFFFAFILNCGLRPIVDWMESKGMRRGLAISLVYILILGFFVLVGALVLNELANQVRLFVDSFDLKRDSLLGFVRSNAPFLEGTVESFLKQFGDGESLASVNNLSASDLLTNILEGINVVGDRGLSILSGVVGGLISIFTTIILSVYMVSSKHKFQVGFIALLPKKYSETIGRILERVETNLGAWLLGQLVLMVTVGIITYFIVLLPGIVDPNYTLARYAIIIALMAGVLEVLPNLGPTITWILTLLIAIATGNSVAILIFFSVAFFALQQLEAIFIVPSIMKKAVDLHPIVSIVGVLAGFELGGPIGALLSVPIVGIIQIIALEYLKYERELELINGS